MNKEYSGPFSKLCDEFIAQKRAIGYRYESEAVQLGYFDSFSKGFSNDGLCLSKELVEAWIAKRPHEAEKTRHHRITVIREFGRFLVANGIESYILPPQKKHKPPVFVPYIFTDTEIKSLFNAADQMEHHAVSPYIHLVMPVLLRMLYGCGLRVSEALALLVKDVDLENGILTIRQSKFDNSRLVPMSNSLRQVCLNYSQVMYTNASPIAVFFPNRYGQENGIRGIYGQYRALLWRAGISHGGRGNGPRLHDLRHTFAVHAMRKLVASGKDMYAISPILSTYLGHKSLAATQKYLRITADMFPAVVEKFEARFAEAVPGRLL